MPGQLDLFAVSGHTPTDSMSARQRDVRDVEEDPPSSPPLPPRSSGDGDGGDGNGELDAALHEEARRRYLNYALSVITSRALPDIRDGLKPVQRRILYAMFNDEHLYPDAKYRKSATVVGAVIGRYHPHGDSAVYEAMVRMAQDFSLRAPLVDGHGNFGSLDGDGAAAYRYTECRLTPVAMELLEELRKNTVPTRATFDGTHTEPIVMPARFPNALVNGATGIAVGMATNIPPHNLGEITDALVALIDDGNLEVKELLKYVKGPDFPTGGQILNSKKELRDIYETGQGAVKLRGEHKVEEGKRGQKAIIITSIPYALNKSSLIESIANVILGRKLPLLLDVRDESTSDVRIVLEIKRDADPALVMAYLYKHTTLQQNFNVNLTFLVPTDNPEVGAPTRLDLKTALRHFLDFRFLVVTKRFQFDLAELQRRIHLLEGFIKLFDGLDEAIKIIRRSEGKEDAAEKLTKRFDLDELQVDAILELRLYKLARLEMDAIRQELIAKTKEARRIDAILKSDARRWDVVRNELVKVRESYDNKRRTRVSGALDEPEFSEEHYIVAEDANVVLTRDGWVKRVRELKDPSQTRLRDGDEVVAVLAGSTKENVVFFSNLGSAYVIRMNDVPPSTGYGDPVQKFFKFRDGERVVSALSLDARNGVVENMVAVSRNGFGLRFALEPHKDASTRSGRKFARTAEGDDIVAVLPAEDRDVVCVVSERAHVLLCHAGDINLLANPGRGVTVMKIGDDDRVIGVGVARGADERPLTVETAAGKRVEIGPKVYEVTGRGGKGREIAKRTTVKLVPAPVKVTSFTPTEVN
jgi:DNA gyrase subunit A